MKKLVIGLLFVPGTFKICSNVDDLGQALFSIARGIKETVGIPEEEIFKQNKDALLKEYARIDRINNPEYAGKIVVAIFDQVNQNFARALTRNEQFKKMLVGNRQLTEALANSPKFVEMFMQDGDYFMQQLVKHPDKAREFLNILVSPLNLKEAYEKNYDWGVERLRRLLQD